MMSDTKIKYKNTSIGTIPSDWKVKKLSEIGLFFKGKGVPKDKITTQGKKCLTYGDLYTKYDILIQNVKSCIDDEIAKESQEIKYGDICFASSGETLKDIGKCAVFIDDKIGYAGGDIIIFRTEQNPLAISYILNSDFAVKQKARIGQGNSIVHIYTSQLEKINIPIPSFPEQQKIAEILATWDKAIQETNNIIKALEKRNKVLGFSLLKGNATSEKTKEIPLGKFLNYTPRETNKPKNNYLALGIRSHGKGIFHKPDFSPEDISMETLYEVKENDFIVNITFAWEQAVAIISKKDEGGLVSHRFPTYVINQNIVSVEYFRHLILQTFFKYMLDNISPGGAGRNRVLSKKDLLKLKIRVPALERQHKVAEILNDANKELQQYKQKLENIKLQKKGLMQQLLTGKIRVKN